MIFRELGISEFKQFQSKIFDLFVDTYIINFQMPVCEAKTICKDKLSSLEKYIHEGTAVLLGGIVEDDLVGIVWLYLYEDSGQKVVHINQVAVDSGCRGRGIGKRLMIEAEKKAADLGAASIDLLVFEANKSALKLYEGLGFETERRYMKKKLQVIE